MFTEDNTTSFRGNSCCCICVHRMVPIVGTVLSTSPICNLYRIVVLPAASRPNMTTCTSPKQCDMWFSQVVGGLPPGSYPHFPIAKQFVEHLTKRVPHLTLAPSSQKVRSRSAAFSWVHLLTGGAAMRTVSTSTRSPTLLIQRHGCKGGPAASILRTQWDARAGVVESC